MRGDKIGIIGRNGAGKTTLLKLLLGQLDPDEGSVRLGTNLQVAYFDQLRDTLDDNKTVQENVADGADRIEIGGKSKHVIGYLQEFLFTAERARTKVRFLSGGEKNRALLARLMTQPANVIVLDEPTNDLDSETLEMLEEQLVDFNGTLLMVSHDRTFLNNVVTSTIVFEEGGVAEYVGGYDDWQATVTRRTTDEKQTVAKPSAPTKGKEKEKSVSNAGKRKLSYKDQRELDKLPDMIEQLESEIAALHAMMAEPKYYEKPGEEIAADAAKLNDIEQQRTAAFARWEELES